MALFIILALTQFVGGCTVVRIQTAGTKDVEVKQHFGIVTIEAKPGAETILVDSTTFGVINSFDGFAVGYHDASMAFMSGNRCQMVIWLKTGEQLAELDKILRDHTGVCVVDFKQKGEM